MTDQTPVTRIEPIHAQGWLVRNGFEQAQIFVRSGVHGDVSPATPGSTWVSVSIMSSFGSWGYHWNHCGPIPWQRFLRKLDREYALEKFMGGNARVVDMKATVKAARISVLEARRRGWGITKAEARRTWQVIDDHADDNEHEFINAMARTLLFGEEYWDMLRYRLNPQGTSFWEQLWLPWVASINVAGLNDA